MRLGATHIQRGFVMASPLETFLLPFNPAPVRPLKLFGTSEQDVLIGDQLDDYLYGYAGNDLMFGGDGDNQFFGGSGDDGMYGRDGNNIFNAGSGKDRVVTGDGDNKANLGSGDDSFQGGTGDNYVKGGSGDDVIEVGVSLLFFSDTIVMPDGTEQTFFYSYPDEYAGGDNIVFGGSGNDHIVDYAGDSKLWGGTGDDYLDGGRGNDKLRGGDGHDTMFGGEGRDLMDGGQGDDTIFAGVGDRVILGGAMGGADTIRLDLWSDGQEGVIRVFGAQADDTLMLYANQTYERQQDAIVVTQVIGDEVTEVRLVGIGADTMLIEYVDTTGKG